MLCSESIYGYEGLKVNLYYTPGWLYAFVKISYDTKIDAETTDARVPYFSPSPFPIGSFSYSFSPSPLLPFSVSLNSFSFSLSPSSFFPPPPPLLFSFSLQADDVIGELAKWIPQEGKLTEINY